MFNLDRQRCLQNALAAIPQEDYPVQSRVRRLKSLDTVLCQVYVKRDDELGFGISGSKFRKYRSLIPDFIQNKIEEVVVLGSLYSNHVLGISQLLIENGIRPVLFLRKDYSQSLTGNALLTRLLVPSSSIQWIERKKWPHLQELLKDYVEGQPYQKKIFILPEGGCTAQALPGALSLPLDILRNEERMDGEFDHVFVESGTGLTAIALILGFAWIEKKSLIHVLLIAGDSESFNQQLRFFHQVFEKLIGASCPFPDNFRLYAPKHAASFGSVNKKVLVEVGEIARKEGFFIDPIYSAKLMLEGKIILKEKMLAGKALVIHSGGALTLAGFQKDLSDQIDSTT